MSSLSPEERQDLLLSVGTHRGQRPLSPVEVAELFEKGRQEGASLRELAEAARFEGTSMVSRFLRLLRLNKEMQHLIDWGQGRSTIAFSAASEIARLPDETDHKAAAQAILEKGFDTSEAKQLVQLRLRSGQPLESCVASILKMRPHIVRKHVFIGALTSTKLRKHLHDLRQSERDQLLANVLAKELPDVPDVRGRLGDQRFTLVGSQELADALSERYEDFEKGVNSALERYTEEK